MDKKNKYCPVISIDSTIFGKKLTMTLIKSISGIRGTIGGKPNDNLTPIDIVESTAAFGTWLTNNFKNEKIKVWESIR